MWQVILAWAATIIAGIVAYYAYTRLVPTEWRASLAGWKTNVFGGLVSVTPEILTGLTSFQVLAQGWEPTPNTVLILRVIGVAIIVLRFISSFEQKEDL